MRMWLRRAAAKGRRIRHRLGEGDDLTDDLCRDAGSCLSLIIKFHFDRGDLMPIVLID